MVAAPLHDGRPSPINDRYSESSQFFNQPAWAVHLATRFHWVLDGITEVGGLWTAEARWWARVEADGSAMLGRSEFARARTIGAVAVLAADAWRCRAALAMASHGGGPMDVYDVVA